MGLMKGWDDPDRSARARMEQAERISRKRYSTDVDPMRPKRYRLYDRIKDRVSVTTMNVIIGATVLLLVIALVVGIATGNPPQ